jgi:hypothetical protein
MPPARRPAAASPAGASSPAKGERRWLLFVHQLPSTSSNLRVRTWRRMQQLGAVAIKQAVYVLPDTPGAREDFEWLRTEVTGSGGDASVFSATSVDAWNDDALIEEFRRTRQAAWQALTADIEAAQRPRRKRQDQAEARRTIDALRQRFAAIERIDFFGSAGRDRVVLLLNALEKREDGWRSNAGDRGAGAPPEYRGRLWVTRPRPGVDRMSSAWLIRRFIDPASTFAFVADRHAAPANALPFDMFGVEFTHRGESCTFETLCGTFGLHDPALARIAAIVHDLDLKDARFGAPEADAIGLVIEGLQLAHGDDRELLAAGMSVFEALYRAALQSSELTGPRVVAAPRANTTEHPTAKRRGRTRGARTSR